MVEHKEWFYFKEEKVPPKNLRKDIIKAWEKCENTSVNSSNKLTIEMVNKRFKKLKGYFDKLNWFLSKINMDLDFFITFVDNEYNTLYTYFKGTENLEEILSVGTNVSFANIGNTAFNMAINDREFKYINTFEHYNQLFHSYLGCADPITIKGEMQGVLSLYLKVNMEQENDDLVVEKKNLLGGLLQTIKLAVFELSSITKQKTITNNTGFVAKYYFTDIIFASKEIEDLITKAKLISKSDQSVLLQGESGTGKELFASAIHNESVRNNGPFVSLNCATLSHNLIESELFGYSPGAFTGALKEGKKGKIELADKGTLFLDEIGELPLNTQAMLLRVIEEQEFFKLGDEQVTSINVRIICASNKNLKKLCKKGLFRWDLFYRLGGMILDIPPLRKRKEDINVLAKYFINKINLKRDATKRINKEVVLLLKTYEWPGNIREFQNILETAHILSNSEYIEGRVIADLLGVAEYAHEKINGKLNMEKVVKIIEEANGNISKAAKTLNVSRTTLYRWLKNKKTGSH